MTRPSFEQRAARAEQLAQAHPYSAEVLNFYRDIVAFQSTLYANQKPVAAFPSLFALVERTGPPALVEEARQLCGQGPQHWEQLPDESFFVKVLLQPHKEYLADRAPPPPEDYRDAICPICRSKPVAGVLRPEGYGARRALLCSLCSTEWNFHRVICPNCNEQSFESLPVYTAAEFDYIRVEACDRCHTYLKTIDLTKNGLAVPVVDELAALPLDLWAQDQGYTKLQRNLLEL